MSEIQDNEILADCAWFADKHRGKNKQSGPYWSTIIRFAPLFDEAARLQKRVDTLEDYIADYCSPIIMSEREHTLSKDCWCNPTIVNKNGYEYPASTRVRCTADGDFPEDGEVVYYEIYDVHYFGKFLEKEATISRWKDFSDEQPYDWYKLDVPIYWKPLASLKDEYERQKDGE